MPMQYTEIFSSEKIENFTRKKNDNFNIFAQNIHCVYTLEPPRGCSNEYLQCMFWIRNKKIRYAPANANFLYKSGVCGGIHVTDMFS